jgi:GNAT superfamily N-acetyltransferase
LARELAAHVQDPGPAADQAELQHLGFGPDRWFECLIAEEGDHVIGFALACKRYEAHTRQRRLWIGDLYVSPDARGAGAGRGLVDGLRALATRLHCVGLSWELWRPNSVGRRFYDSLGARENSDIVTMQLGFRTGETSVDSDLSSPSET